MAMRGEDGRCVGEWVAAVETALAEGRTVLVPGETAAGLLRGRMRVGVVAGVGTWMAGLWGELVVAGKEERLLLNAAQEHAVWREIVGGGPAVESLESTDALAAMAMGAFARAARFGAVAEVARFATTHDARLFAEWAAVFGERCAREGMVAGASLAVELREHAERGDFDGGGRLGVLGFASEEVVPTVHALMRALVGRGWDVVNVLPEEDAVTTGTIVGVGTPAEERVVAARWVREFLRGRVGATAAIVTTDVAGERAELEAVLLAELAPELQDVAADLSSTPWAFATRETLAGTAVAVAAMDVLRWVAEPLGMAAVSALLVSEYVGAGAMAERAGFDAFALRTAPVLRPEMRLRAVYELAVRKESRAVAAWLQPMLAAEAELRKNARRSYGEWMEFAREALRAAGWPGERTLNPQDFADVQAWEHALDGVATLDFQGVRVEWSTALHALQRSVAGALRGRAGAAAAVTVLSPAQAAGCRFDAVVVLHGDDAHWPGARGAHALLGRGLQREYGMPGADAAGAAARASAELAMLAGCADAVVITYAREDAFGALRVSPLVRGLGWDEVAVETLLPAAAERVVVEEERVEDAVALPALRAAHVLGGAKVLQLQAQCGFRAFAEVRLEAHGLEASTLGMDAGKRGSFLHAALDEAWKRMETQSTLLSFGVEERRAMVAWAVEEAVPNVMREEAWDEAYLDVQKERLRGLLMKWMEREEERGPFRVVGQERVAKVQVGPLLLDVRVDRMDEVVLRDGSLGTVIVDYKSGVSPAVKQWEGERPDDPQLPLYAMLPEAERLQAIAFAKVLVGEKQRRWLGYEAEAGILPKAAAMPFATMAEQMEAWKRVLVGLAEAFAAGEARVDPKEWPGTCAYCEVRLLCRLDAASLSVAADAETDEGAGVDDDDA